MITELEFAIDLLTSAGIGLLVGLERSRNPLAKAGLRTFAVIAVLGTTCTLAAVRGGSPWLAPAALVLIGAAVTAASLIDPATRSDDSGTTTIVAALLVFVLGALIALGERRIAVGSGIALTALLHFKGELEGFSKGLTAAELRSMLQFGALAAIVLPLLPHAAIDPLGAVSPFNVGLMAVLISAISLSGYVAWRLSSTAVSATAGRRAARLLLQGVLGGVVSSTATTLAQARRVKATLAAPEAPSAERRAAESGALASALAIILLANATMLVRVLLLTLLVAVDLTLQIAVPLLLALLVAAGGIALHWRKARSVASESDVAYRNPAQLGTALVFAAVYAGVLFGAAWLQKNLGAGGVYAIALASGTTDVDAITLSSLRLATTGAMPVTTACIAIAAAVGANLLFKAVVSATAGGMALGRAVAQAFALQIVALALGAAWVAA